MKILNKPIKVMAIFNTDGKIEPVKFRLEDQVVRIEKILKTSEESLVGNKILIFVCQHIIFYLTLSLSEHDFLTRN